MTALADIGLGTLFSGNAGLLQLTLLPGLLAHEWQSRSQVRMPMLDSVLFVFASSAVASFLMVLLLQSCGLHTAVAWQVLAVLQSVLALWLCFTNHRPQPGLPLQSRQLPLLSILALLIYLFCLIELLRTLIAHWPGALEGWDAIVSWNRWARDWAAGQWPHLTWDYPQLVPALWSVLYLWQDSTEIEVFIRIWMGLFAVALVLVFLAAYAYWRRWPLLLAGAAMTGILLIPYSQVLDGGYVDVPVTFAVALAVHWQLLALSDETRSRYWLLFATVATALALLIKQGGLLALLPWLWTLWCLRSRKELLLHAVCLLLVLVVPWYVLSWWHGSGDSVVNYVTRDIYGSETLQQRIVRALEHTLPIVTGLAGNGKLAASTMFIAIAGVLLALRDRGGRLYVVFGGIGLLGWAGFFSYDGRNLLPTIPLILFALAHGYGRMHGAPPWLSDSLKIGAVTASRPFYRVIPVLALAVLAGAWLPPNVGKWERLTNNLRLLQGDPDFNRQLIELVNRPSFSGEIYTTYPQIPAIRELRGHWFNDYGASHMQPATAAALQRGAPLCEVIGGFARHERISYLVLHDWIYPGIVNTALMDGTLQQESTAPNLKLLRVNCGSGRQTP